MNGEQEQDNHARHSYHPCSARIPSRSDELGRVLLRAEFESRFERQLAVACEQRCALFIPESEAAGWKRLLGEL